MSKDRDGIAGDLSGDDADDSAFARTAPDGDAAVESDETAADALTDPESDIADADEVEAELEAAEESVDAGAVGSVDVETFDADSFEPESDDIESADADLDAEDQLDDGELSEAEDADEVVEEAAMAGAAAGAGSARAAARGRAPVRAGTTAKKVTPTKARETHESTGPIARITRFLREVVAELRKVIWPSRRQMVTYTIVVIVFLAIMVALVAGLDVLFLYLAGAVFA